MITDNALSSAFLKILPGIEKELLMVELRVMEMAITVNQSPIVEIDSPVAQLVRALH